MQDAFCALQAAENVIAGVGYMVLGLLLFLVVPALWAMVIGRNRKK